jgi:hypothetical protein
VADRWFSAGTPLFSINNKTECLDIAEILLKVALNTGFSIRTGNLSPGCSDKIAGSNLFHQKKLRTEKMKISD